MKFFTRRMVVVAGACFLAALGTLSLYSYVRGIEAKASEGADLVEVYVAKDLIRSGTTGDAAVAQGLIGREAIPRRLVSGEVVRSLETIHGRVAAVDVLKGEQVLESRFVDPVQARGLLRVPEGRLAVSVEVALPPGVAGYIQPGDTISIIAAFEAPSPRAFFLLQNIYVIAVGSRASASAGDDEVGAQQNVLLTLALTPGEAEKVVFALYEGRIHLALVPPNTPPADSPGRTFDNIGS